MAWRVSWFPTSSARACRRASSSVLATTWLWDRAGSISLTSPTSVATTGRPVGHGLDQAVGHLFGVGGQGEDVEFGQHRFGIGDEAGEGDAIGEAEFAGQPLEPGTLRPVAGDDQADGAGRVVGCQPGENAQQAIEPLFRPPARRPSRSGIRSARGASRILAWPRQSARCRCRWRCRRTRSRLKRQVSSAIRLSVRDGTTIRLLPDNARRRSQTRLGNCRSPASSGPKPSSKWICRHSGRRRLARAASSVPKLC